MLGLYQTLPGEEPQPRKKEGQKLNQKDISSTKEKNHKKHNRRRTSIKQHKQ